MIDALAGPGTAVDIRISTLEPVQQLRMHFANILSAELSRMRADAAFASVTGTAVQAPAAQDDHLRAQQRSVLGQVGVSLRSNGAMLAETTTLAEHFAHADSDADSVLADSNENGVERRVDGDQRQGRDDEAVASLNADSLLIDALRSALVQFKAVVNESGFSGSPLVLALPAEHILKACAPADLQDTADTVNSEDQVDVLILCLAFDGSIGEQRTVQGVLFKQDSLVAQLDADWSEAIGSSGQMHSTMTAQPRALVSEVMVDGELGRMSGIRVKLDDMATEPAHWFWHVRQWSWL